MRIAVPTDDGIHVAGHFGKAKSFLIFESGAVVETRPNGGCQGGHAGFAAVLAGCNAILCLGIGQGAVDALQGAGIAVVHVPEPGGDAAGLVAAYTSGTLPPTSGLSSCICNH